MKSRAPLVALTATTKQIDGLPRVRLNEAYVDAVRAVGLTPFIVPPLDPSEIAPVLDAVQGMVLTGGEDVDPGLYGATRSSHTDSSHPRRDACEIAITRAAHVRRLPTLAICRGLQVANVALGGTLIQDIASECRSTVDHDLSERRTQRVHDVHLQSGSRLAQALGDDAIQVNSSHHQALAQVADGLRVSARAPDGIVEGVEWNGDDWWLLGVQWHPEELIKSAAPWDRALFQTFADRVRAG
jgi:putative glutamine amidotransferase